MKNEDSKLFSYYKSIRIEKNSYYLGELLVVGSEAIKNHARSLVENGNDPARGTNGQKRATLLHRD